MTRWKARGLGRGKCTNSICWIDAKVRFIKEKNLQATACTHCDCLRYESLSGFKQLLFFFPFFLNYYLCLQLNHIISNRVLRSLDHVVHKKNKTNRDNNDTVYNQSSALFRHVSYSDTIRNNSLSSLCLFSQIKGAMCSGIQAGVDVKWLVILSCIICAFF